MTDFIVILNDGTTAPVLNDGNTLILLNQTSESQPHGIWEGSLAPPETVRPWKEKKKEEESGLELLIVAEPVMGQLFKTDLSALPYLKQYEDKLYDIIFQPIKNQTFDEFKLEHQIYKRTHFINAELSTRYESPHILLKPFKEQMFRKTLYGEKLHGINIINMVRELMGSSQSLVLSFDFADKELAHAVTNKPPIGEPTEEERELE